LRLNNNNGYRNAPQCYFIRKYFCVLCRITRNISTGALLPLSPYIRPLRNRKLVQAVSESYK